MNLRTVEKLNTILIAVMLLVAAAAVVVRSSALAYLGLVALLCVLVLNRHLYAFFAGLISGVIFEPVFLLFVSLAMIGVAFYLHTVRSGSRLAA